MIDILLNSSPSVNEEDISLPELEQLDQWVVHRAKVPYIADTGELAKTNDPSTWRSFQVAIEDVEDYDGPGFVFSDTDNVSGIDLDHCCNSESEDLELWAIVILRLCNSYTEISFSGNGLHILIKGKFKFDKAKKTFILPKKFQVSKTDKDTKKMELFRKDTYFAVTYNHLPNTPTEIVDNPDLLEILPIVGKLLEKDVTYKLLIGEVDSFKSRSEALHVLLKEIARLTKNAAHIYAIANASLNPKWHEEDERYREREIEKALAVVEDEAAPKKPKIVLDEGTATWADLGEELTNVTWAWEGWIANGFVTMIVSQSGAGKSHLAIQLAATYIRGDPWPNGQKYNGRTGKVLWIETEAAQAINYGRAKKMGLPADSFVTPSSDPMQQPELMEEAWRERIREVASRQDIVAVFVDSLSGSHNLDEKSNQSGEIVRWLAQVARDTGKPFHTTHHIRKKNSLSGTVEITLDDVRGSTSQVQYARVVMALDVPDASNKDLKRLQVIKSNLSKFPQPLGLEITGDGIVFTTAPKKEQKQTALNEAGELLMYLWDNRQKEHKLWVSDLQHEAEKGGVSWKSMLRAKDELGFKSKKKDNRWYWYLPFSFSTNPDQGEEEREG